MANSEILDSSYVSDECEREFVDAIINNIEYFLVLFCNPISGNQEGKLILATGDAHKANSSYRYVNFEDVNLNLKKAAKYPYSAIIFNLVDKEESKKGKSLLKSIVHALKSSEKIYHKRIKVVIAGGDGTTLSMIQDFDRNNIDINYCLFGCMPLGTGNDLSNALGFSASVDIDESAESLYKILAKYFTAMEGKVDVWKVELTLDANKGKLVVNTPKEKKVLLDEDDKPITTYRRTFINYFSFGYDARVGFSFDKSRTGSRCCNKCCYCWEGFKKNFFRQTMTVPEFIESFSVLADASESEHEDTFMSNISKISNSENENFEKKDVDSYKIKFKLKSLDSMKEESKKLRNIVISGRPCSIICQNIYFYMAGTKNIWGNSSPGIEIINVHDKEKEKLYAEKLNEIYNTEQKLDDKKLEFFTFESGLETGLEKMFSGHGRKLYHGYGPYFIKFAKTPEVSEDDKRNRIYMNIDGEYFQCVCPVSCKIELDKTLCDGQLPFLINKIV